MILASLLLTLQDDRARVMYHEALRVHTVDGNLERAIVLYQRVVDRNDAEWSPRALLGIAVCCEAMDPPEIDRAQEQYQAITSRYGSHALAAQAQEKLARAGVDVLLGLLAARIQRWRDAEPDNPAALEQIKEEAWPAIESLGERAVPGLLWALGHEDPLLRDFAAEKTPKVVGGSGIEQLIRLLADTDPLRRAGAAMAVERILRVWSQAKAVDKQADEIEQEFLARAQQAVVSEEMRQIWDRLLQDLRDRIERLRALAQQIRANIPASLTTDAITGALQAILLDEEAHPSARVAAARMAAEIGDLEGPLVDTLLQLSRTPNGDLRAFCAGALGSIKPAAVQDRTRAAQRLGEMLQYEPEKDERPHAERDWGNTPFARASAAGALSRIRIIVEIPALIEGLGDNDADVRQAANEALRTLTRKDVGFSPRAEPADREAKAAEWQSWWEETGGVEILVFQYWDFQTEFARGFDVSEFYDLPTFQQRLTLVGQVLGDTNILARGQQVAARYNEGKGIYQNDVVALGERAVETLVRFLGGEMSGLPQPNRGLMFFCAETLARIGNAQVPQSILSGSQRGTDAQMAGAAVCLGFLGGGQGGAVASALGGAPSPLLQEACAYALTKLRDPGSASAIASALGNLIPQRGQPVAVASSTQQAAEARAALWLTRALIACGARDANAATVLARAATSHPAPFVRAVACEGLTSLDALLAARMDPVDFVRAAASQGLRRLGNAAAGGARAAAQDTTKAGLLREGAFVALSEDLGGENLAEADDLAQLCVLILRGDGQTTPPDSDPRARTGAAKALAAFGKIQGALRRDAVDVLVRTLSDEAPTASLAAYHSLVALTAHDPELDIGGTRRKFSELLSVTDRARFGDLYRTWMDQNAQRLR